MALDRHIKKAIVKYTGEIVTLSFLDREAKPERAYYILEDVTRTIAESDLFIIEDFWEFLTEHMTDYYRDQRVADSDDIECCLFGEADEDKLQRVRDSYGDTPEQWLCAQIAIDREMLEEAVHNFMSKK